LGRQVRADGVGDRAIPVLAPAEHRRFIQGAVCAEAELLHALGQIGHGLFQNPHVPAARGDVRIAELVVEDDILLRPEHHDGLVAARPVVGHGRRGLIALHERGVHVEGRRAFPGPALETGDERAIRAAESGQRGGLFGDRRLRAGRPEGASLHVERLQEVPHRRGRGQRVPEERGQGLVLAERREILTPVPAARPEHDQALHEFGGRQAPLALLHGDLGLNRLGHPELAEQLNHQRHPGTAGDEAGIDGVINLERQPRRRVGHRVPPCACCTHWVHGSKPDAMGGTCLHSGLPRNLFARSTA
jgi:hypothetical protein